MFERDPHGPDGGGGFIAEVGSRELRRRALPSLPFDRVLLDLLDSARLLRSFQVVNGKRPDRLEAAIRGEHVGTIVHAEG